MKDINICNGNSTKFEAGLEVGTIKLTHDVEGTSSIRVKA
jgi:hypothetical protein